MAALALLWDVFNFNDELDLLEMRLELLADTVDVFVVVEAPLTFTGKPKPMHFLENSARFARWDDKLRHVTVEYTPTDQAWDRENEQRRTSRDYLLSEALPEDLIVFGDVDEIPDPQVLAELRATLDFPVRLGMVNANYYANWVFKLPFDNGPIAFRLGMETVPELATVLGDPSKYGLPPKLFCHPDAGWHISFSGGPDAVKSKLASYSHQELNPRTVGGGWEHSNRCLRYGVNPAGYDTMNWIPINEIRSPLSECADRWPLFFHPEPFSEPGWKRRAYAGYAYLRRRRWLPAVMRDLVDTRHDRVFTFLSPGFFLFDLGRRLVARGQRELRRGRPGTRQRGA